MGNLTSNSTTNASNASSTPTNEKHYHSFEELNKGGNSLKSLNLKNEEKPTIKHRFSEPRLKDKGLRDQYFQKLKKGKKDVEEMRMSLRNNTLLANDTLNEDFDNLSYANQSFFAKRPSENLVNESLMDLESKADIKSSFQKNVKFNFGKNSKNNSGKNSRNASPSKNSANDKLDRISVNSAISANSDRVSEINVNINNPVRKNPMRRSLSQKGKDQSSYANTKNTLFLNNELENVFDAEVLESQQFPNQINISKRRSIRKNHSSDMVSMMSGEKPFEPLESNLGLGIYSPNCNDTVSEMSNLYSNQKSRITLQNNDYELNFINKGEDLRRSYIAKLIYKKVWQPSKKEKDHNTLIIFDWDDTLLCTSFLTPNGVFNEDLELNDKEKEKLAKLEFSTLRILTAAIQRGDTYIITNAAPGWVEYSSERFYPSVRKILDKVKIISARGDYESIYPGDSRMWKIQAFLNMQKTFDNNLVTNIICLGDSFIEMEAAHVLASKFSQAFIKTIKFRESPKPEELNKQLSLVADQFPVIYSTIKNLTIRVEKKIKK